MVRRREAEPVTHIVRQTYHGGRQWSGFEPGRYRFNTAWSLPVTIRVGDTPAVATTVGGVVQEFPNGKLETPYGLHGTALVTSKGTTVEITGPSFRIDLIDLFLGLQSRGLGTNVWLCPYDSDHVDDDAHASYVFFMVGPSGILDERVRFSDYRGSGFDPDFIERYDDSSHWMNSGAWAHASAVYWYRKFYTETTTGQLMRLRDDKPTLHYFTEPGVNVEAQVAGIQRQLVVLNGRIVLALLILAGIAIKVIF
jgi:hypothetical protein